MIYGVIIKYRNKQKRGDFETFNFTQDKYYIVLDNKAKYVLINASLYSEMMWKSTQKTRGRG